MVPVFLLLLFGQEDAPRTLFSWTTSGQNEGTTHRIQFRLTIRNTGNLAIRHGQVWALVPLANSPSQVLVSLSTNFPGRLHSAPNSTQVLQWQLPDLAPFSQLSLTVEALLRFAAAPPPIPCALRQPYLIPEPFIECEHPAITTLASRLMGSDLPATAKNIYNWVLVHIQDSGYIAEEASAVAALHTRRGDCTDMASLFVALSRAAGIPARLASGYIVRESSWIQPYAFHNWAEFHDGTTWRIADPQAHNFDPRGLFYLTLCCHPQEAHSLLLDAQRFRSNHPNLSVSMDAL